MSIKYRMYQDNRKNSKHKGFWYARAVSSDVVGIKELALRISNRCTVTEPDILAVISALVFEMNQVLKSGSRVKIDDEDVRGAHHQAESGLHCGEDSCGAPVVAGQRYASEGGELLVLPGADRQQ